MPTKATQQEVTVKYNESYATLEFQEPVKVVDSLGNELEITTLSGDIQLHGDVINFQPYLHTLRNPLGVIFSTQDENITGDIFQITVSEDPELNSLAVKMRERVLALMKNRVTRKVS